MAADIYYGTENDDNESNSWAEMYGYGGNDNLESFRVEVGFVKIYGGSGSDTLWYTGLGTGLLKGGKGADTLWGGNDDDKLIGGRGGDWLFGGLGNDWLKGNKGKDHFAFDTAPDTKLNKDMIVDFQPGKDLLHFNSSVYTMGFEGVTGPLKNKYFNRGKGAEDGNDYFGYNPKNGKVWYDENGNDPGGKEIVAILDDSLHIKASYFHFD